MVSNLAWAVQGWSGFAWECIHPRGIGRRQVSCCCQWSASQEVFPEHVGRRVTRADEIHLAVIMIGQHVELASKIKKREKKREKKRRGQHVELASKNIYEKQDSRCLTIDLRCFKQLQVLGLTGSTNCFLSLSTSSGILLWRGWLLCGRHLLVLWSLRHPCHRL